MGRTKTISLCHLIFIFQSVFFTMIYASPMIDNNGEKSNTAFKNVLALAQRITILGLSQRIDSLETKQIIHTETRSLVGVKNEQQELKKYIEEMRRHQEEIKHDMEEMRSESQELMHNMEEMRSEQRQTKIKVEKMRSESQELMQNMEKMRSDQRQTKIKMKKLRIQQEQMRHSVKEMRSESRGIMQNMEEMRSEKQKIKQNMDEMMREQQIIKHNIEDLKLKIVTAFQQNKENYGNLYVDRDELKTSTTIPITYIKEIQSKENRKWFDIVQRIKYDVDNEHMIHQQQNNISSTMKAIRNSRHVESVYKQKGNENDTNQVMFLDMQSNSAVLNQSLKYLQQRIREVDTNMSHLQSQYNEHYTDSSSAMMEIRNSIKQADLAYQQNINELDEKQMTLMLHIKSEFRNLKQRFERLNQRIQTFDAEFSSLHIKDFVFCIQAGYTYIPETGICIKLHKTFVSWYEARETCAEEKATLIMIRNMKEYNAIKRRIGYELSYLGPQPDCGYDDEIWVGANDMDKEGDFQWWNGQALTTWQKHLLKNDDVSCPNWGDGSGADCVVVNLSVIRWTDRNCNRKVPFVCQLQ